MRFAHAFLKKRRNETKSPQFDSRAADVLWNRRCVFKSLIAAIDCKIRSELPDCIKWHFTDDKVFSAYISGVHEFQIAAECKANIIDIQIDCSPYLKRRHDITFKYLPITQSSRTTLDWLFVAKAWISENIMYLLDALKDAGDNPVTVTLGREILPRDREAWPELARLLTEKGMNAFIDEDVIKMTFQNKQEVA